MAQAKTSKQRKLNNGANVGYEAELGYPPDKQEKATQTVLEQVELLGWEVAA